MTLIKSLFTYAKANMNVLLKGPRGFGKTEMAKQVFNELYGEMGKDWLYFSVPTMDPHIQLTGIPKIVPHETYGEVTRVIPVEAVLNPRIKAIFFDEINRGEENVLNALMEITQFGTLNGIKLQGLRVVWAAGNFNDEEDEDDGEIYQSQAMDPAQLDRFECVIDVEPDVSEAYFTDLFGELGKEAVKWWKSLPDRGKEEVSARRLEKVTKALSKNIPITHMLPSTINASKLVEKAAVLKASTSIITTLTQAYATEDDRDKAIQTFLNDLATKPKAYGLKTKEAKVRALEEVAKAVGAKRAATMIMDSEGENDLNKSKLTRDFAAKTLGDDYLKDQAKKKQKLDQKRLKKADEVTRNLDIESLKKLSIEGRSDIKLILNNADITSHADIWKERWLDIDLAVNSPTLDQYTMLEDIVKSLDNGNSHFLPKDIVNLALGYVKLTIDAPLKNTGVISSEGINTHGIRKSELDQYSVETATLVMSAAVGEAILQSRLKFPRVKAIDSLRTLLLKITRCGITKTGIQGVIETVMDEHYRDPDILTIFNRTIKGVAMPLEHDLMLKNWCAADPLETSDTEMTSSANSKKKIPAESW